MLKIEMGIGWKPDPEKPGHLVSANIRDYVAEIERLRAEVERKQKCLDVMASEVLDRNQRVAQLDAYGGRLRAALRPFADIPLAQDGDKRAPDHIMAVDMSITPRDVRAAREALGEPQS